MSAFGKKFISIALALLLLMIAVLPAVSAAEDSTEAEQTTISVRASQINESGAYEAIQAALNIARFSATENNVYKVVVERGSYVLEHALKLYSNTCLSLDGVTLTRDSKATINMIRTGDFDTPDTGASGYGAYVNITIEGGVLDGGGTENTMLKVAHARSFRLLGVEMKNVHNGHMMEIAGVDGFTVKDCSFKDQRMDTDAVGYEVIQLDILKEGHIFQCRSEALPMKNVLIENCSFENCPRGIGTHTAIYNCPFSGIKIKNNTFTDISSVAIQGLNWANCEIRGNTIKNCPRGIAVYSMLENAQGTFPAGVLANEGKTKTDISESYQTPQDSKLVIAENTITGCGIIEDKYADYESAAISVIGKNFKSMTGKNDDGSGSIPAGDYYVDGVEISGNTIDVRGHGIRLGDVRSTTIKNNSIVCSGNDFDKKTTFENVKLYGGCKITSIEGNDLNGSPDCGIWIDEESSVSKITDNGISNAKLDGIMILNKSSVPQITDNYISNIGVVGISVNSKSTVGTLEKNTIYKCGKLNSFTSKNSKMKVGVNSYTIADLQSVKISHTSLTMGVGETYALSKSITPTNAKARYTWTSNNPKAVAVDSNGKVKAVGEGKASVIVKASNGMMDSCSITVGKAPDSISLNANMLILGESESFDLNSTIPKGSASQQTHYFSNNPTAASVEKSGGLVKANNIGTATVVVKTYNNLIANCNIIVKAAPYDIRLDESDIKMGVGEESTLSCGIPDETASKITFSSSNSEVVSVDENGAIVAKAEGTATITANTFNGYSASCSVTVQPLPDKVELSCDSFTVKAGESYELSAKLPEGTSAYNMTFKSSDPNVCHIDKKTGVATGKLKGKAVITVTACNGVTDSCEVTVE